MKVGASRDGRMLVLGKVTRHQPDKGVSDQNLTSVTFEVQDTRSRAKLCVLPAIERVNMIQHLWISDDNSRLHAVARRNVIDPKQTKVMGSESKLYVWELPGGRAIGQHLMSGRAVYCPTGRFYLGGAHVCETDTGKRVKPIPGG